MAVIRSFSQPTVESRPMPGTGLPNRAAPVEAFGNAAQTAGQARDMQVAGQFVDKAADSLERVALTEMRDMNETRVQELANGFISGQQFTLYTDKDAFYRKKGQDAINGAQGATDKLLELKKETIGLAANDYQRRRLATMLDAQVNEATNGISRHVAVQSQEWQKSVAEGRQALLRNQAALDHNDVDKVEGLAAAAEGTAREQAKQAGVPGTDAETAMVVKARSDILTTAITQRLQSGDNRSALALYDKVKHRLDERDSIKLASVMKSTATDVAAEDWIGRNAPSNLPAAVKQYIPQVQQAAAAEGVPPELAIGVLTQESGGNKGAVSKAGARGLMQLMPGTARDLGVTDPHDEKQSIPGGVKYLGQQLAKYNGDRTLALMAYNWGPGSVDNWIKTGKDPAKVPEETRNYVQAVNGFAAAYGGVGFEKANVQGLVQTALGDSSLNIQERTAVVGKLQKASATTEAARTATIKGLDDTLEATTQLLILAPDKVPKGALANIAAGYKAAGDQSKAVSADLIASLEDTLRDFSAAPKSAQDEVLRQVAASQLTGKSKALADSLISAGNKDKAETVKATGEDFAALKVAAASGVRMETMEGKAKSIVDGYVKAGDFTKAREAADFYDAQVRAQAVNQAPPTQVAAAIGDMRTKIEAGEQTNTAIKQLDTMQDVQRKQAAAFDKDALATGASVYSGQLGPLPPMTDLPARAAYATQVSRMQGGRPVLPFTDPEIENLRTRIDQAPPEQQAKTMQALSALPADMIPGVAAALAGKKDAGDPLSRSYAAALSFYADKDPASRQIADQILGGAEIQKRMGEAGKKAPTSSPAWQSALQDRMGNVFFDMKGMPAVVADAVASVYTWQMHRAGRQGETIDPDVLDKAITTVMGNTVTRHGQTFLPPVKGMDTYEVDRAIRSIRDADLTGLRTTEGDPITADVLIRKGVLTNAGRDGIYFVRIPDPRAGMDLRPVTDADGRAWRLDLRPYVERARQNPASVAPFEGSGTPAAVARRRAPASPTANVSPGGE